LSRRRGVDFRGHRRWRVSISDSCDLFEANYDPASASLGSLVTASRTDMLVMDAHGYGGCGGVAPPNPIVFTNGGNLTFTEADLAPQLGGVNNLSPNLLQLAAIADVNGDGANDESAASLCFWPGYKFGNCLDYFDSLAM
jgi:hypothetical protein